MRTVRTRWRRREPRSAAISMWSRDICHGGIDRKHGERQEQARQCNDDSEIAVDQEFQWRVGYAKPHQRGIEQSLFTEDGTPRINAHQISTEQRHQHELQHQLCPVGEHEPHQIGQREGDRDRDRGRQEPDANGAQHDVPVETRFCDLHVIYRSEAADDVEPLDVPEAQHQQAEHRHAEEYDIEENSRREHEGRATQLAHILRRPCHAHMRSVGGH